MTPKEYALKELANKAVDHVVGMMLGKKGEKWEGQYPVNEGVCGWCGVMAPLNRPAFVAKFGEDFTKAVETAARAELARREAFWINSEGFKHSAEAAEKSMLSPSSLKAGDFVFGRMMHLKCEGGFRDTLSNCVNWPDSLGEAGLCKIERVIECDDVAADKIGYRTEEGAEGGSDSDDMTDELMAKFDHNFQKLPKEYQDTFYTKCALVRDRFERYYLIDFEGHDHARYIVVPVTWETMYKRELDEVRAEKERKEKEAAEAKAKEEAESRAAYEARCAKWEGLMVPATPQRWGIDTETGKKNILAMAKAAFPWVRFWVGHSSRWGHGYTLKWTNGPTAKELGAVTDFGLFSLGEDTFNGYDDSTGYEEARFTDFAKKYGGCDNGVVFERKTAEKDMNRDPKAAPKAPKAPKAAKAAKGVEVRENAEKNGLEIGFPSVPSGAIRDFLKANGWKWSKWIHAWWHKATDKARKEAEAVVEMWEVECGRSAA